MSKYERLKNEQIYHKELIFFGIFLLICVAAIGILDYSARGFSVKKEVIPKEIIVEELFIDGIDDSISRLNYKIELGNKNKINVTSRYLNL